MPEGAGMAGATAVPDQGARLRIAGDVATTLFVDAGAGSGKTTALVTRVASLVLAGARLRSIAAVTFTEKAAAELRDRIRLELEAGAAGGGVEGERCRVALGELDGAAVGTLHAFAQRLLSEHPLEVGLPPRIEVLDEVSSGIAFDRRWRVFRDELLADPGLERTILLLLASGVRHDALRVLARAFDDNWDLVAERVPAVAADPGDVLAMLEAALAPLDEACAERDRCTDLADKLRVRLDELAELAAELRAIDDELALVDRLGAKLPSFKVGNVGRSGCWPDAAGTRARVAAAGEALHALRGQVGQACARRIAASIRGFTLSAADERRRAGRLEFHDLLVLARTLLRDPQHGAEVRQRLHTRYTHLLLDEFQDTDPMQIELAVRIAAARPATDDAGADPWVEVPVAPGQLFVVGDPKQSIYRFRRADIATFLTARSRFGPEGGGVVELTTNFRTGPDVIAWVNAVFAALMGEPDDVALPVPSQPDYLPLTAVRPAPAVGPPVALVGRAPHPAGTKAEALRAAEATDVAAVVARAVHDGWEVDDGRGGFRAARLGDVCILVPARTSLPYLEQALEDLGIPFRAESSSLVYATRAVRDLLMAARAIDDPTNELAVVSALRTPLFACGDDDLFRYKVEQRGRWDYTQALAADPDESPVAAGLAYLERRHRDRRWMAPSQLLEAVARDRRAYELGVAEGRPRDVWRRLRFVVDEARGWSEVTGGSLRQYLQWLDRQAAGNGRVAEAILPETDDDAVRIMTIHAAKGLEFPITIVSGMSTVPGGRAAAAEVVFPPTGAPGYRFGASVTTDEFELHKPIDEQMGLHERIRLLYVACTRARDHLVVSLHRAERRSAPRPRSRTNAELLVDGMGPSLLDALPDAADGGVVPQPIVAPPPPSPLPPFGEWERDVRSALERAARPVAVAATALTPESDRDVDDHRLQLDLYPGEAEAGLQKRPYDLDVPPWLKGRYGSAVGRAVHGVLQVVDLRDPRDLDAVVVAQCEAEAVPERVDDVRQLASAALASDVVVAAAEAEHWRELYVCVPVGERMLEGYVDLLYRTPDGVVVVDHKTSASSAPAELDRRVARYRQQGGAYALAVGEVLHEPVARVVFLFLTPQGAIARDLPRLDRAVAEVRVALARGDEVLVGG